ncbi:hypothetical protein DPEC_G00300750 [Dallia pectoralis]|uniref:Uncharacterized protein n=1 Tax=Dallia pectoralis TaxID=75939 RepID=A0ACC2FGT7_DALPE|nr:hypothetical protein DPEC_G00300750 [Dallia pectoralis]
MYFECAALWINLLLKQPALVSGIVDVNPDLVLSIEQQNHSCAGGTYFSAGLCVECPSGYFCPGNVSAPKRCPAGSYNHFTGRSIIEDCKPCLLGLISREDRVDCSLCPAGFLCDPANGTLEPCPPGQHSPEGHLQCLPCPYGSVCPNGHIQKCEPGEEPDPTKTACTDCSVGSYSSVCVVQCRPCPAGTYCPHRRTSEPSACLPGQYSMPGQTHCKTCNSTSPCGHTVIPGWSGTAAWPAQRSRQTASSCPPGTHREGQDGGACVVCPLGHYCTGDVALPCSAGSYGPKEGLRRARDCPTCPAGFYCLEGSSQRPGSEFMCPQGYYCEEGTGTPHGSPCPAGTAGQQLGQTSRAACRRCSEGRFCPEGSAGPGLPCARGRFCPAGTLEEVKCPRGTFTPHQGAISVKDCLRCPAGFYCPEGTLNPMPCQPGTFNPLDGQDEETDCRECYPGKACTKVALKTPDVDCMQGFACPPGSSKPNAPANACPPGSISNRTDLTDRAQCQRCPARYACLPGTGGLQRPPVSCFPGHYCPPGTMFPTQHKCPVGTWSERSGLEAESECRLCPRGWYCLAGVGTPSGRCSSGHYCPEGTMYGTQYPCPPGTYSTRMGNGQLDDCHICPGGSFCPEGTSKPAPCPPSTFRRLKGGLRREDCSVCPAGYFCPLPATVHPRMCGAGSYSDQGSVECAPCLQGHYCSNDTTSEEVMLNVMVCPAGLLCSQGLAREPQRSAVLCPRGFYCPGGGIDPNPIPCPHGTFSRQPGLRDLSECTVCPVGKYCYSQQPREHPIIEPTGNCPDGFYCPLGTGHPNTWPCDSGFYRNNSLGHHGDMCVACPARVPTVLREVVFPSFVKRAPTVHVLHSAVCLSAPLVTGAGIAEEWEELSPRVTVERAFTAGREPLLQPQLTGRQAVCVKQEVTAPRAPPTRPPAPRAPSAAALASKHPSSVSPVHTGPGNTTPTGLCYAGYYCTGASASPVQNEVQEGYYTQEGAFRPEPCPVGTFQPGRGYSSCIECQRGRLCNQTGMSRPGFCPTGHYCPPGSAAAHPCPPGSYADQPGGGEVHHCSPCDAGWFCRRAGLSVPQGLCDKGFYCTSGASSPTPVGVASGGVCPAGYVCPEGSRFPRERPCPAGTWGNVFGAHELSSCQPCPPGVYCNATGLIQPSGMCAAGFYCSGGAKSPTPTDGVTGDLCPQGSYCPVGSAAPKHCPDGSYSNHTGAAECLECPPGKYCLEGEGAQLCPEGHYCLGGTADEVVPCPPGTYSPKPGQSHLEQCLLCPAGMYCEDWGLAEPTGPCQAGYFCLAGLNFRNPDENISTGVGGVCPKGHYCPEGTSLPLPCPLGTFSNRLHVTEDAGCSPCSPGQFCHSVGLTRPSGPCQEGFYCPGGDSTSTGSEGGGGGGGRGRCPPAHYCPAGSANPVPCPAGGYANMSGLSRCPRCHAGYYCPERTSDHTQFPCPPGFYCPDGTRHATQFPCPRGYYNPEPMTQSLDSCLPCPPGHYCEKERLTAVSGKCKAGWFCVSAAWTSQPYDLDNYTNANCLCPATSTGGRCQEGFFCPLGSSEPLPCPPGAFCNVSGLALPTGPCTPGYFCTERAVHPKPTDGRTGNICPPGTYCEEGSSEPEACPAGTFSPVPSLFSVAQCQPCTAGFYCAAAGLESPTGPCSQGYYCDLRWALRNASMVRPCPKGHYCPPGTTLATQYPCPPGSYNPRERIDSLDGCMSCPPGLYCPTMGLAEPAGNCSAGFWCRKGASTPTPVDGISGSPCPAGQYCPSATPVPTPCPPGTWSNSSGLGRLEECRPCTGGHYCDSANLTAPTGPCAGGYYCLDSATTPTPATGPAGGPCPEGHYCPVGTAQPLTCEPGTYASVTHAIQCFYCLEGTGYDLRACPEGTYSPESGLTSISQCRQCDRGHYCPFRNSTSVTGQCLEGYYCSHGNTSPEPPALSAGGGPCPAGHYCPRGTADPLTCPVSTFSNLTKLVSQEGCVPCSPGFYCDKPGLTAPTVNVCPEGYYCPGNSSSKDQYPCPAGTINPNSGMTSPHACLACPPGLYCGSPGLSGVSGRCSAGYLCLSRAVSGTPVDGVTGDLCPRGHYCPEGAVPHPCPVGFYSNTTGNTQLSDCLPCDAGFVCATRGLSFPSDLCQAGKYCPYRHNSSLPGYITCSAGHMCPQGSGNQVPCAPGTYQDQPGQALCATCPAGFYCSASTHPVTGEVTGTSTPLPCPMGHYCPPGTQSGVEFPCPVGTFGGQTGTSDKRVCVPCPPGRYCSSTGLTAPTGHCSPGYLCIHGAITSQPADRTGGKCAAGSYCPSGIGHMLPCPPGTFSTSEGAVSVDSCRPCLPGFYCADVGLATPSGSCNPGFYCPVGSRTPTPNQNTTEISGTIHGDICPAGHYCPNGTAQPVPCPPGTSLGRRGGQSEADCEPCPPGFYCPAWGQTAVDLRCPRGWFCPVGSASGHQPECLCRSGHSCPHGSAVPSRCAPGTYQPLTGQWACTTCPAGSYCVEGSVLPSQCPAGSVSPTEGRSSQTDCSPCPPGFYCNSAALTSPSGPCMSGHFCSGGATGPAPVSQSFGDVCPSGHYCPDGTGSPRPCPAGSFHPERGATSTSSCYPCPPGRYCLSPGSILPTGPCSPGFYCTGGADSGSPRANCSQISCHCDIMGLHPDGQHFCAWLHNTTLPQDNNDSSYYCPVGSAYPRPCDAGSYCGETGLKAPSGLCTPGHFCPRGSTTPHASPCLPGYYCPLGTALPLPCPPGTLKRHSGGSDLDECHPCPPGHYCGQTGSANPSGLCAAGFFCPGGQSTDRPEQHVCGAGHFCVEGSVRERACDPGSYQSNEGRPHCETCPSGFYCLQRGMTNTVPCERGFYCPFGSVNQRPCPAGTYGNLSGLAEESECSLCEPGMYCKGKGNTSPSGQCSAGFVCVGGASLPSPSDNITGALCPAGNYCPVGSSTPAPCPKGTFSELIGLTESSQCRRCFPGFYCAQPGLSAVTDACQPGFYCLEGSQKAAPVSSVFGGPCYSGHYCERGSSVPTPCPAGTHNNHTGGTRVDCEPCPDGWFQDLAGQRQCQPCPPGFHCPSVSTSGTDRAPILPLPCPAGYACPGDGPFSQPYPCPKGTYSPSLGITSLGQCMPCPAGQFCGSEGLVEPTGPCSSGFLCVSRATIPNPTDNRTGSLCPAGLYCQLGLRAGACTPGFYCDWGSSSPEEAMCPAGYFCPGGTRTPLLCPGGTQSSVRGNSHQDNCTICPAGYYCQGDGVVQPVVCPLGHYCPPGSAMGVRFPCPPGTVQSQLGATSLDHCLPCPAGMFCAFPGLSEPTGPCQAGYHCPPGAISPNAAEFQGNSTSTNLCPRGYYCPAGTGYPLPCPPGTLSTSPGLRGLEECQSCPSGHFCDRPGLSLDAALCSSGYVCLEGSITSRPSGGRHGYPCPAGHYCPTGTAIEVPCEPGTYSPSLGSARCLTCPNGTACSSSGTREASLCPAGHFCPAGCVFPIPCPVGTLYDQTGGHSPSVCRPCPPGLYCDIPGISTPQGQCQQGFFCQGGAPGPVPQSSASFPRNGPCPVGHYCLSGSLSPLPCPAGSIRNQTGGLSMDSCFSCPPGHYCSNEGLASPTGLCAPGFYCPFDFSSTTPYAFLCPKGHYCPEGSPLALPCSTGEYQPNPGSESCIPCRPGFYCEEAVVGDPWPCPPHSYCPAATMVPQTCPNGTFTPAETGGLQEERECLPCLPGWFCRAGKLQGRCAAGHLCMSGSSELTPQEPHANWSHCEWGMQCAGPCPAGFYCPEGSEQPEVCPGNTIRVSPGAATIHECLPCPPQHWCKQGDPVLHLCPAGHYCDGLVSGDSRRGAGPTECPLFSYRSTPGAGSKGDCDPCPPGTYCTSTGLTDYSGYPCPPGYWCRGTGPPILCPAGTMRPLPGAAAPSQCEPCVGGSYCPDPRSTGQPNVAGIPCRASYQCPPGTGSESLCKAGSYCGPQTAKPEACPEGYICPEGSQTYNTPQQVCPFPYYCPSNSSTMLTCEGGSMPRNTSGPRASHDSSCRLCEAGTYRPRPSPHPHCLTCPPGYYCPPADEEQADGTGRC